MDEKYTKLLELREKIKLSNYQYYVKHDPIMSDIEFDRLFQEAKELEKLLNREHEDGAISNLIGSDLLSGQPETHSTPMLSLDNAYNLSDMERFLKHCKKHDVDKLIVEPKLDGVSISIIYINGILTKALTRGDGTMGEDVTENVKMIQNLPITISSHDFHEFRGEIIITDDDFNRINANRPEESKFKSSRNLASGTLRQLDSNMVVERNLKIFLYTHISTTIPTQIGTLSYMRSLKLPVIDEIQVVDIDIEEISRCISSADIARKSSIVPTDGLVFKVNDTSKWKKFGSTARVPRYAIAYKFAEDTAISKVLSITAQIGRSGKVTPVAELDPVILSGALISRATLHNYDLVKELDLKVNDHVVIERAAAVIPKIKEVLYSRRLGNEEDVVLPVECPMCGFILEKKEGLIDLFCMNTQCTGRILQLMEHFCSKGAFEIDGLSIKRLTKFYNAGIIKTIPDILRIPYKFNELIRLENEGAESIGKLIKAIEHSIKKTTWSNILYSLGIPGVGKTTANDLAILCNTSDMLLNGIPMFIQANEEKSVYMKLIQTIGMKTTSDIFTWLTVENKSIIAELVDLGINNKNEYMEQIDNKLNGLSFCITGKHWRRFKSREEMIETIKRSGGTVDSGVKKTTDYLIAGREYTVIGTKRDSAAKFGTPIISEDEFLKLLEE